MKAYIIYHPEEALKNASFIDLFKKNGLKYGIYFEYISCYEYKSNPVPDLVINRTRDYTISLWYEKHGACVFHSSIITKISNDKYLTIKYLEEKLPDNIFKTKWCPDSYLYSEHELRDYYKSDEMIRDRFIIKALNGHGGTEVFYVSDLQSQKKALAKLSGKDCIVQEVINSDSNDIRVYIVGGRIYAAILRHGNEDFRSNYSLGGCVSEYKLNQNQKEYIEKFIEAFGGDKLGMAGIDFILDKNDNLIFNELEEMVGSRMLYKCTDKDIVSDYLSWIHTRL